MIKDTKNKIREFCRDMNLYGAGVSVGYGEGFGGAYDYYVVVQNNRRNKGITYYGPFDCVEAKKVFQREVKKHAV